MYQPNYYPQPKKSNPWPWIILAIFVLAVVIGGFSLLGSNMDELEVAYTNEPNIARIFVEGPIMGQFNGNYDHQFLLDTIDALIDNDDNKALLVYVDTPGGELLASDELSQKILEYKNITGRAVYIYGHNMMASGGYWLACAGDWVVANKYCITGSIGVTYGSMIDISGLLEKYGVNVNTITSGDQKSMGSYLEEMTPKTEAIFQVIIDEYYQYFIDWISTNRGITRAQLVPLADGRIYTATQAYAHQLIDQVGTYEDALAALNEELGGEYPVVDYISYEEISFLDQINWLDLLSPQESAAGEIIKLLPPSGPLAYYEGQ